MCWLLALVEPERTADLDAFLDGKDVVDLLRRCPGIVADAKTLVSILPPLALRLYSISSSQLAFPEEVPQALLLQATDLVQQPTSWRLVASYRLLQTDCVEKLR